MSKLITLVFFLTSVVSVSATASASIAASAPVAAPAPVVTGQAVSMPSEMVTGQGVEIRDNQLWTDGQAQPQLFGAELQYFRLRGGYGKNVPRATVIALWNKALDRMVEAHMNAISFYIPWDFHEYAEGKFDFDGTADEDGDGNPDYPSRDVKMFFKLIAAHGIKNIMVRPGPYVNAEWGFLGFGAIPQWFHEKYPDSHMLSPWGLKTKLYDYHNADLLHYTQLYFQRLYDEVLHDNIGPGKPIKFVQLDNETNFMWQSLYNHDYSPSAVARYQQFLQQNYASVADLNAKHGTSWQAWADVKPPVVPKLNNAEDQDWYRFQDYSIYTYLAQIRKIWEQIGVHEPDVMFTLAESYNASDDGLLPNYRYRNSPGVTGMMTTNLYPKTYELGNHPLHNQPFKADLDVLAADEASDLYLGRREEWAMGPEIQGGWWKGTPVSEASRQQTYLTIAGHGLKSFFVYYFNEGNNFGTEWAHDQVTPIFNHLCQERGLDPVPSATFPDSFWSELQARSDRQLVVGIDVRSAIQGNLPDEEKLYFDASLDGDANPSAHFYGLKNLGEKLFTPYGTFLAQATSVFDSVAIIKDTVQHQPSPVDGVNYVLANSDWAGGLLGYMLNDGLSPRVLIGDVSPTADYTSTKVLVHIDTGVNAPETLQRMSDPQIGVLNFISDSAIKALGFDGTSAKPTLDPTAQVNGRQLLSFYLDGEGHLQSKETRGVTRYDVYSATNALSSYTLPGIRACTPILYAGEQVMGYRCVRGNTYVTQIGALLFDDYNESAYAEISDAANRRMLMQALMKDFAVEPQLKLDQNADHVAVFSRHAPANDLLWITVKTPAHQAQTLHLALSASVLPMGSAQAPAAYTVTDLLGGTTQTVSAADLISSGFVFTLAAEGSTVLAVRPAPAKRAVR